MYVGLVLAKLDWLLVETDLCEDHGMWKPAFEFYFRALGKYWGRLLPVLGARLVADAWR